MPATGPGHREHRAHAIAGPSGGQTTPAAVDVVRRAGSRTPAARRRAAATPRTERMSQDGVIAKLTKVGAVTIYPNTEIG